MDNKLLYTRYEFEDLVRILQDRLAIKDSWKDTYASSTGQTLIELYAYLVDLLLYYLERRTEECYIRTARNRSSILNLVSLLNYKPKRNVSAVGTVRFTANKNVLSTVVIPEKTIISTSNNIEFVTISPAVINTGYTQSTEVKAIQGSLKEILREAPGTPSYEITIDSTKVENNSIPDFNSIEVLVSGERWEPVSSFLFSSSIDRHYMIRHELDDTITIIFGDGKRGLYPAKGAFVKIEYLESDGLKGNVYALDAVTSIKSFSSITYEYLESGLVKQDTCSISVTNTSQMVGGDDAETTEEIRLEAPNVFKTGDRLVTKEDFTSFLFNYPQIGEALVWGEFDDGKGVPIFQMFNVVKIAALLKGWTQIGESLQQTITNDLYKKSLLTVKYVFVQPNIYRIVPVVSAKINRRYSLAMARSNIENAISSFFVLGETAKMGQSKRLSNLIEAVDRLEAVEYLHMYLDVYNALGQPTVTNDQDYRYYSYSTQLKPTPIKQNSIRIYCTYNDNSVQLAAISNGTSFQVASTSVPFSISTSNINYASGDISITFRTSISSQIAISSAYSRYQQDTNGDIIVEKQDICKLETIDFVDLSYE